MPGFKSIQKHSKYVRAHRRRCTNPTDRNAVWTINTMSESKARLRKYRHPGAGKRKTRTTNRGRQIDHEAALEIRELLGEEAFERLLRDLKAGEKQRAT